MSLLTSLLCVQHDIPTLFDTRQGVKVIFWELSKTVTIFKRGITYTVKKYGNISEEAVSEGTIKRSNLHSIVSFSWRSQDYILGLLLFYLLALLQTKINLLATLMKPTLFWKIANMRISVAKSQHLHYGPEPPQVMPDDTVDLSCVLLVQESIDLRVSSIPNFNQSPW